MDQTEILETEIPAVERIKSEVLSEIGKPIPDHDFEVLMGGDKERYLDAIFEQMFPEKKISTKGEYAHYSHRDLTPTEKKGMERFVVAQDAVFETSRENREELIGHPGIQSDLMSEYKIHFQIKQEYKPYFLRKLCACIQKDEALSSLITQFKVAAADESRYNGAESVIYLIRLLDSFSDEEAQDPQGAAEARLFGARKNFETALAHLWYYFSEDLPTIGETSPPNFNSEIQPSLYVAQSTSGLKSSLIEPGKVFDPQTNYSFRAGETAPTITNLKNILMNESVNL